MILLKTGITITMVCLIKAYNMKPMSHSKKVKIIERHLENMKSYNDVEKGIFEAIIIVKLKVSETITMKEYIEDCSKLGIIPFVEH